MATRGYTSCAIPDALADRIDALIDADPQLGYRNRGEFVVDAVRRLLEYQETHRAEAPRESAAIIRQRR